MASIKNIINVDTSIVKDTPAQFTDYGNMEEESMEIDLSNYYKKKETDDKIKEAIRNIPPVDLSNYYNKDEVNGLTDHSNYYTKSETESKIDEKLSIVQDNIDATYSKGEIDTKITEAINTRQEAGDYATRGELNTAKNELEAGLRLKADITHTHAEYATQGELNTVEGEIEAVSNNLTTNYFNKTEVLQTKQDVIDELNTAKNALETRIDNIQVSDGADLTNYYTKQETDGQITQAVANIQTSGTVDLSNYATTAEIARLDASIENVESNHNIDILRLETAINNIDEADLTDYYTKAETNAQITQAVAGVQGGAGGSVDLSGYYNKQEVDTLQNNFVARIENAITNNNLFNGISSIDAPPAENLNSYPAGFIWIKKNSNGILDEMYVMRNDRTWQQVDLGARLTFNTIKLKMRRTGNISYNSLGYSGLNLVLVDKSVVYANTSDKLAGFAKATGSTLTASPYANIGVTATCSINSYDNMTNYGPITAIRKQGTVAGTGAYKSTPGSLTAENTPLNQEVVATYVFSEAIDYSELYSINCNMTGGGEAGRDFTSTMKIELYLDNSLMRTSDEVVLSPLSVSAAAAASPVKLIISDGN